MSAPDDLREYRFATDAQWASGLLCGASAAGGCGVSIDAMPALTVRFVADEHRAAAACIDPAGRGVWRTGDGALAWMFPSDAAPCKAYVSDALSVSARFAAGRKWLWAFEPDAAEVVRYDASSLYEEARHAVGGATIRDLAYDARDGVWLLVDHPSAEGASSGDVALVHVDARNGSSDAVALAAPLARARGFAWLATARRAVVLTENGGALAFVDPTAPEPYALLPFSSVMPGFVATLIGSDARERVLVGGRICEGKANTVLVLDASGALLDTIDADYFGMPKAAGPITGMAARGASMLLTTAHGIVWLTASPADGSAADATNPTPASTLAGPSGATGVFLTPTLLSPVTATLRGWLRAELDLDLPSGASATLTAYSTDDLALRKTLDAILGNPRVVPRERIARLRAALTTDATRSFRFDPPQSHPHSNSSASATEEETPIRPSYCVPLFDVRDRWLWLCVELNAVPDGGMPRMRALRVLYPEVSLMQMLPAIYRGAGAGDTGRNSGPTDAMRSIVGVLEALTQDIDRSITRSGTRITPSRADGDWLDFVARWLDLPWDDALTLSRKRALLGAAETLLAQRGTRAGLQELFRRLLPGRRVRIVDVGGEVGFVRLGGIALPALLTGLPPDASVLSRRACLGNARLCADADVSGTARFEGWIRIEIEARVGERASLERLVAALTASMMPAGLRVRMVWKTVTDDAPSARSDVLLRLDDPSLRRLAQDARLGQTVLDGARVVRITDVGTEAGFRLE